MRQRKKIQKMLRPGHVRQCSERPPSLGLPARQGPADAKDHLLQTGQLAQGHEERNANKHPPMHKGARMRGPRKSLHYPGARHGGIGGVPTPSTKSGDRGVSGLTLSKTQRAGYSGSEHLKQGTLPPALLHSAPRAKIVVFFAFKTRFRIGRLFSVSYPLVRSFG